MGAGRGIVAMAAVLAVLSGTSEGEDSLELPPLESVALDNGALRIEFDVLLFEPRFIGFPGGRNFVEALHVDDTVRAGKEWTDAGGLVTDVIPGAEKDPALRRGPGEILSVTPLSLVVQGPESPQFGLRLKKELYLDESAPEARFIVSLMASNPTEKPFGLRNMARVNALSYLRVKREEGALKAFGDSRPLPPNVVPSRVYWMVPIPPTAPTKRRLLGGYITEFEMETQDGIWTRTNRSMPAATATDPEGASFLCLIDGDTKSYGAAFQGELRAIGPLRPLTLEETWRFDRRGTGPKKKK